MPIISLEGLDASGKSTQIKLLKEYFKRKKINVFSIHFPRLETSYWGKIIKNYLHGKYGNIEDVHPQLISILYAGDRWEASQEIINQQKNNNIVLLDRYVYSNIAYQCAKLNDKKEKEYLKNWILNFEFNYLKIPKPDINIFLDVPHKFIIDNIQKNKANIDIHEKRSIFLEHVREEYLNLCENNDLIYINCNNNNSILTAENILKKIINKIKIYNKKT